MSSNRTFNHSMDESNELADNSENDKANMKEHYLIVSINSADETMRVYRYANGLEYQYYYGLTTRFLNKYGDYTSIANFKEGDVINISETDLSGRVTEVRLLHPLKADFPITVTLPPSGVVGGITSSVSVQVPIPLTAYVPFASFSNFSPWL